MKRKMTEEGKKKISRGIKKAHAEGRHPGWKHINENDNHRSYPECYFLSVMKNEGVLKQFRVVEKMPIGRYFLDFAFVDIKLDLEIDGAQHVRSKETVNHDRIRDSFMISKGWTIYRIAWNDFCLNKEEGVKRFLNFLNDFQQKNVHENRLYKLGEIRTLKPKRTRDEYAKQCHEKWLKNQSARIDLVLSSGIDFTKWGWTVKVADLIKIPYQKARGWMKACLPNIHLRQERKHPVSLAD